MAEVKLKTHLIITDIRDEYHINWCGKIADVQPAFTKNGLLKFVVIGSNKRVELDTLNMIELEQCAKGATNPKGRSAITNDTSRIYILDKDGKEHLIGVVSHNRIKSFAPMYDKIGYR